MVTRTWLVTVGDSKGGDMRGVLQLWHRVKEILSINPISTAVDSMSAFLAEHGFVVRWAEWQGALLESEHFLVALESDYHSKTLLVRAVPKCYIDTKHANDVSEFTNSVALSDILRALDPEVKFVSHYLGSVKRTRSEIERQLRLLFHYCRYIQESDCSIWPEIMEAARSIRVPAEGESLYDWSLRIKQMMRNALESGNYALADEICNSLRFRKVELTPEDEAVCRAAAREVDRIAKQ